MIIAYVSVGSFLDYYVPLIFFWSVFVSVPYFFNDCRFVRHFEIRECDTSSFVRFKIVLAIGVFYVSTQNLELFVLVL